MHSAFLLSLQLCNPVFQFMDMIILFGKKKDEAKIALMQNTIHDLQTTFVLICMSAKDHFSFVFIQHLTIQLVFLASWCIFAF